MIINKVYHLKDLHIRNLQRHKEYRQVFRKFLKQVKEDKIEDSVIYIAGDIIKNRDVTRVSKRNLMVLNRVLKLREVILITAQP